MPRLLYRENLEAMPCVHCLAGGQRQHTHRDGEHPMQLCARCHLSAPLRWDYADHVVTFSCDECGKAVCSVAVDCLLDAHPRGTCTVSFYNGHLHVFDGSGFHHPTVRSQENLALLRAEKQKRN